MTRHAKALKKKKKKSMTYFDENRKNSIKSTAIEKFKGKMLMFS